MSMLSGVKQVGLLSGGLLLGERVGNMVTSRMSVTAAGPSQVGAMLPAVAVFVLGHWATPVILSLLIQIIIIKLLSHRQLSKRTNVLGKIRF